MFFAPSSLPSKSQIEEFFNRLNAILMGIFLAVLLILAMVAVVAFAWEHTRAVFTPPAVHAAPFEPAPSSSSGTPKALLRTVQGQDALHAVPLVRPASSPCTRASATESNARATKDGSPTPRRSSRRASGPRRRYVLATSIDDVERSLEKTLKSGA